MLQKILRIFKREKDDFKKIKDNLQLKVLENFPNFRWVKTHTNLGQQISLKERLDKNYFLIHIRPVDKLIAVYPSKYYDDLIEIVENELSGVKYSKNTLKLYTSFVLEE